MTSASLNGSTAVQSNMTPQEASYTQNSRNYHDTMEHKPLRLDLDQN